LLQKVSESIEKDDESNVSNKPHCGILKNGNNSSFNNINHNGNNGIDDKGCKKDYPGKNTLSKDISKKRKRKNASEILLNILNKVEKNFNDSCEFVGNSKDTVKNGKNILTKNDILSSNGISCSNKSSSSDNLAITENSDHENVAVVNDIQVTENISTAVVCSNSIDQDFHVIDSDDNSDILSSDLSDSSIDINNIILGVKKVSKESFPELLKLFSEKEMTYEVRRFLLFLILIIYFIN